MGQGASSELLAASATGNIEQVTSLLDRGVDVNSADAESDSWTALHHAAWGGYEKLARELLVRGANVNARNIELQTPLHLAVLKEDHGLTQALCDHGGLVNAADEDGLTALHVAANQGLLEIAQELIARGADVNAHCQDGRTALHLAARRGHGGVLSYLLNSGSEVDQSSITGQTALHEAASNGQEAACKALLKHGADPSRLDSESHTAADIASTGNLPHLKTLLKPPAALQVPQVRANEQSPAEPSAPAWQPSPSSNPITYPTIFQSQNPQPVSQSHNPETSFKVNANEQFAAEGSATNAERLGEDWEPRASEDDWEGVEATTPVPSQGSVLMNNQAGESGSHDPFWMVPGPVKWLAGNVGGMLQNLRPFKGPAEDSNDARERLQQEQRQSEAALEREEQELTKLLEPVTKDGLTKKQLTRLREQEAEIAELRKRLEHGNAVLASLDQPGDKPGKTELSSKERHHLFDMPALPRPEEPTPASCREVTWEELATATDGFSASNRIRSSQGWVTYKGTLNGAAVAIRVPNEKLPVPWHLLKATADQLAALPSLSLAPLRAVSREGCTVNDLLGGGTVEGALSGRPPMPGRPAVRLNWQMRLAVAQSAARGLADLQRASLAAVASPITPSRMLLADTAAPRLQPPDIPELSGRASAQETSAYAAPEVKLGEAPTSASNVYSLGILMLQLLTGSEAAGLLDYVQRAVDKGSVSDILDPCAEGISSPQALDFAKLALRCTSFHAENRPSLVSEVIPKLDSLTEQSTAFRKELSGETPSHLVCPITQEIMERPVILSDGYTYEEAAIKQWLASGKKSSPMTNEPLQNLTLTPNYVIKSAASSWREKHPGTPPQETNFPVRADSAHDSHPTSNAAPSKSQNTADSRLASSLSAGPANTAGQSQPSRAQGSSEAMERILLPA